MLAVESFYTPSVRGSALEAVATFEPRAFKATVLYAQIISFHNEKEGKNSCLLLTEKE